MHQTNKQHGLLNDSWNYVLDYECITVLVNVTSNTHTGDVVTRGELRMSEREYVLDHTPPWVHIHYI